MTVGLWNWFVESLLSLYSNVSHLEWSKFYLIKGKTSSKASLVSYIAKGENTFLGKLVQIFLYLIGFPVLTRVHKMILKVNWETFILM